MNQTRSPRSAAILIATTLPWQTDRILSERSSVRSQLEKEEARDSRASRATGTARAWTSEP